MYVTNITAFNATNDWGHLTDLNTTNNITDNCTNKEKNIDFFIPTL